MSKIREVKSESSELLSTWLLAFYVTASRNPFPLADAEMLSRETAKEVQFTPYRNSGQFDGVVMSKNKLGHKKKME